MPVLFSPRCRMEPMTKIDREAGETVLDAMTDGWIVGLTGKQWGGGEVDVG